MKIDRHHRVAGLRAGAVVVAAAMLALTACTGHTQTPSAPTAAPPPPPPQTTTYQVSVTVDPQTHQVAVSPMTVEVASGTTATVHWVAGSSGYQIVSVQECKGGGFSTAAATGGTVTVTDNNTGSNTTGDWPYQVTVTDGKNTYATPSCSSPPGTQRPIIKNR